MTNKGRMNQIGELQDELESLGFKHRKFDFGAITIDQLQLNHVLVTFTMEFICGHNRLTDDDFYFNYGDPELTQNLLNKVKDLINASQI